MVGMFPSGSLCSLHASVTPSQVLEKLISTNSVVGKLIPLSRRRDIAVEGRLRGGISMVKSEDFSGHKDFEFST